MTATNKSQAARLRDCGVNVDTADMCRTGSWLRAHPYVGVITQVIGDSLMLGKTFSEEDFDLVPAWSLEMLLTKVLPKRVTHDGTDFDLVLQSRTDKGDWCQWELAYYDEVGEIYLANVEADDPIEACVRMMEKLKEKGLV